VEHSNDLLARHATIEDVALADSVDTELDIRFREDRGSVGRDRFLDGLACICH
jgi:hypothetical protein